MAKPANIVMSLLHGNRLDSILDGTNDGKRGRGVARRFQNTQTTMPIAKFINHSRRASDIAGRFGWLPGARYTNLRDVRTHARLGFLDIDWKNYDFHRHLEAAIQTRPLLTVARDIERKTQLSKVIDQAYQLLEFSERVVIVPKPLSLAGSLALSIPDEFILGYSVPTRYGGTRIPPDSFHHRVHLLGGRPDVQRRLADLMDVVSMDCNRFTLDASFGDYFDGETFRPHPVGGYERCIRDSIRNINVLWRGYKGSKRSRD